MCAVTGRAAEGVDQNDVPWAGDVPRAEKWGRSGMAVSRRSC